MMVGLSCLPSQQETCSAGSSGVKTGGTARSTGQPFLQMGTPWSPAVQTWIKPCASGTGRRKIDQEIRGLPDRGAGQHGFLGQQYLAIAFGEDPNEKNQIKIFQLPSGELQSTLSTRLGEITSLKFIPGTGLLMVGSFSGGVELWDIESGEKAFTLQPEQPPDDRCRSLPESLFHRLSSCQGRADGCFW